MGGGGGGDPAFIYWSMLIDRGPASLHCCWEALATHMSGVKSVITEDKPVNPLGFHLSFAGCGAKNVFTTPSPNTSIGQWPTKFDLHTAL